MYAQCNGDVPEASLFCDSAPVLCQIECLDGFTGTLPEELIMPQPMSLCDGGIPNNLSWFAFVAGSDSINLTLIPSNCTNVPIDTIFNGDGTIDQILYNTGVQAGIYANCDFSDDDAQIVCSVDCNDVVANIELASGNFVLGQTYYLLVDGCAGSVCDYEVQVNFGDQAFEMPEITTISNQYDIDFSTDTVCAGATIEVVLDDLDLDVQYTWSISPANLDYPDGLHPVTDSNVVDWVFNDPGTFEICVFASNFCDVNNTVCFEVFVDTLADEYFTDILVCQECFPIVLATSDTTCIVSDAGDIVPTILTEDPNGDNLSGWFGFTPVMGPGTVITDVGAMYGCTYQQIVNVVQVPIQPRVDVRLYRCVGDFPFDYLGETITGPVTNRFITLDNQAASGCDSLLSLTVEEFGAASTITAGDCVDGGVELSFDLAADLPAGTTVGYSWLSGTVPITDTDGIDTTMLVTASGVYSVEVTLNIGATACTFVVDSDFIDIEDVQPIAPDFGVSLDNDVCASSDQLVLWVEQQNQSVQYLWDFTPTVSFLYGATSDTVYVDISGGVTSFDYCVVASNDCGESTEICDVMTISEAPTVDIAMDQTLCLDSVYTFVYEGDADLATAVFYWTIPGGMLEDGTDLQGPGPHGVSFDVPGSKSIFCQVEQGDCITTTYQYDVTVLESFEIPLVDCTASPDGVVFTISELPAGVTLTPTYAGALVGELVYEGGPAIQVSGLEPNTQVDLLLTYMTSCGLVEQEVSCTSLDCQPANLEIVIDAPEGYCLRDNIRFVATAWVDGAETTAGTWAGDFIDSEGIIAGDNLEAGTFMVSYTLPDDTCPTTVVEQYTILESPSLTYEVVADDCGSSTETTVILSSTLPGTYGLAGMPSADGVYTGLSAGSYIAEVSLSNGCSEQLTIDIAESTDQESVAIVGDIKVPEDTDVMYFYETTAVDVVDLTWYLNSVVECTGLPCEELIFTPVYGDSLCIEVVLVDGCVIVDCIAIETYREVKVFFPNVFSPNGDGNNDVFFPATNVADLQVLKMDIYDRWGNCVYTQKNQILGEDGSSWDGQYQGRPVPPGVYVYHMQYVDEQANVQEIYGDVTVVR